MKSLSKDDLAELTTQINERIAEWEFPENHSRIIERLPRGIVRLAYDVIAEWWVENSALVDEAYERGYREGLMNAETKAHDKAFTQGFDYGIKIAGQMQSSQELQNGNGYRVMSDIGGLSQTLVPETIYPDHAKEDDDPATLGKDWPAIPDGLEDGVDRFAEHPVSGEPEPATSVAELPTVVPQKMEEKSTSEPAPVAEAVAETVEESADEEDDAAAELKGLRMGSEEKAAELRNILIELQVMSHDGMTMPTMEEWDKKRPKGMTKAQAILKRHNVTWRELAIRSRLKMKGSA